jgi:hypothetical protein
MADEGTERHADRNTLRTEALYALRDTLDDVTLLGEVHGRDFDPQHAFADGQRGPALRVGRDRRADEDGWLPLAPETGALLARYIERIPAADGAVLFGTDDIDVRRPPTD